jgi:hypothetical protein
VGLETGGLGGGLSCLGFWKKRLENHPLLVSQIHKIRRSENPSQVDPLVISDRISTASLGRIYEMASRTIDWQRRNFVCQRQS